MDLWPSQRLELGMELLVRGMVFVQFNDVLHRELLRQCRRPALQFVIGQQQRIAVLVDGALDQAQYATRRVCLCANALLAAVLSDKSTFVIRFPS